VAEEEEEDMVAAAADTVEVSTQVASSRLDGEILEEAPEVLACSLGMVDRVFLVLECMHRLEVICRRSNFSSLASSNRHHKDTIPSSSSSSSHHRLHNNRGSHRILNSRTSNIKEDQEHLQAGLEEMAPEISEQSSSCNKLAAGKKEPGLILSCMDLDFVFH